MQNKAKELDFLLGKLQRNQEKLGLQELKTTYGASYRKLCQQICEIASNLIDYWVGSEIIVSSADDPLINWVQGQLDSKIFKEQIRIALFKHMDVQEVEDIAMHLRARVLVHASMIASESAITN